MNLYKQLDKLYKQLDDLYKKKANSNDTFQLNKEIDATIKAIARVSGSYPE